VAKRKLNDRQRVALREEIRSRLSSGIPQKEVVKSLASKYKISPISLRWYIRHLPSGNRSGKLLVLPTSGDYHGGPGHVRDQNGHSEPFEKVLNRLSEGSLKRLLAAKKLVPQLQLVRRYESELRGKIRELERRLQAEEGRARVIERKIKRLSGF
jgi:hypothetical protein